MEKQSMNQDHRQYGKLISEQGPDPVPLITKKLAFLFILSFIIMIASAFIYGLDDQYGVFWSVFGSIFVTATFIFLALYERNKLIKYNKTVYRIWETGIEIIADYSLFIPYNKILWAGKTPNSIRPKIYKKFGIKSDDFVTTFNSIEKQHTIIYSGNNSNKVLEYSGPPSYFEQIAKELEKRGLAEVLE